MCILQGNPLEHLQMVWIMRVMKTNFKQNQLSLMVGTVSALDVGEIGFRFDTIPADLKSKFRSQIDTLILGKTH